MNNPCDSCNGICWQEITCPECLGSGIWQGCAINSISIATWYGLQYPLNLLRTCRFVVVQEKLLFIVLTIGNKKKGV